jgi:hypothetical protein
MLKLVSSFHPWEFHFSFSFQLTFIKHSLDTEAPHPSKMIKPSLLIISHFSFIQIIFNSLEYLHSFDKWCSTQPILSANASLYLYKIHKIHFIKWFKTVYESQIF